MDYLLDQLIRTTASTVPDDEALACRHQRVSYGSLDAQVDAMAGALAGADLQRRDRVAIYLSKTVENVVAMFAVARAGGVFVPVNPVLKSSQVGHILRDSGARMLVTTADRYGALGSTMETCPSIELVVLADRPEGSDEPGPGPKVIGWQELLAGPHRDSHRVIDIDIVSILYTSGSTGNPKGVVLSHRNMVDGARSVASYLENHASDRLLAVLPFSFDVGFSQLSTAFCTGGTTVLHDYFLPRDVLKVVEQQEITGITGVPPLWMQLADLEWPERAGSGVRYFANTGGKMPRALLQRLRDHFPNARPYLMYGLTEAFRSTYLPPQEVDRRPDSIGKAIPNAEILVIGDDGKPCAPGEPGELVHRGALVSMGYWNDPERTAERFKPIPGPADSGLHTELAVWSGDIVKQDEDGFLYFIGRRDGMIKTSGYRVSPTEIEEAAFASGLVGEAAAIGVADDRLGQRIVLFATPASDGGKDTDGLSASMKRDLPAFMVPSTIKWRESLPRNSNGKIDRRALEDEPAEQGSGVMNAS
jgi:acyl-CoA ligase (AMP-forming) (exosortase A-associated)